MTGRIAPKDSTARFQEQRDGAVHGILNFNNSRTGNLVLRDCTTESAAGRLTVTTFASTDRQTMTGVGTCTPMGGAAGYYRLSLSGARGEIGAFTLTTGNYTCTFTLKGIVDVTCPPVATLGGQR